MEKKFIKKEKNVETYVYFFTPEEVEKAETSVVKNVNANYTIPGFRRGRVPLGIVRSFLGESFEDMVLETLSESLEEELKGEELYIPALLLDQRREDDIASIEVQLHREPEITLKGYEGLELMIPQREEVLSNYLDNRLEELRNEHAIIEPKSGPAEIGDLVNVEYTIVKDNKKIADKKVQEIHLAQGDERPIAINVLGKSRGETVQFARTFENSDNEYAYTVVVKDVFKRSVLELDDEFARTVSAQAATLEELKEEVKEEGLASFLTWRKDFLRQQAMDKIGEFVELELADSTLDYFVVRAIENSKKDKSYEGYLKQAGSAEKLAENFKQGILDELKKNRFIEEVAQRENLKVEEDELEAYAEELAPQWGISLDRAREMLASRQDIRSDIRSTILRNKVLDKVIEKAKVSEVVSSAEPLPEGQAQEALPPTQEEEALPPAQEKALPDWDVSRTRDSQNQ